MPTEVITEEQLLSDIKEREKECEAALQTLYDEMRDDLLNYAGSQWEEGDVAKVKENHGITATHNELKKQVDSLVGRREQTLTDLKAYPVEILDDAVGSVATRLLKWTLDTAEAQTAISPAYKNATIAGLGWVNVWKDAAKNIRISSESPLYIRFDPQTTDLIGLSDCDFIFKYKLVNRKELKKAFPDKESEIDGLSDSTDNQFMAASSTAFTSKRKGKVLVKEYWYRSEETKTWVVNPEDPDDAEPWGGDDDELTYFLTLNPHLTSESRTTDVIKVTTYSGSTMLQDAVYSTGTDYPFFPIVGYFQDGLEEWEYRVQGFIRNLKEIQKEINARHSAMLAFIMKNALTTYVMEEGSVKDIDKIKRLGGKVGIMQYNRGTTPPQAIPQMALPASEVQMLQVLTSDLNTIGLPPEITGAPGNIESAKGISLVQATGLTSVAEINSHLNFALRKLGAYVLKLITETYSIAKMQRIIGQGYTITPELYSALRDDLRFDVRVDETSKNVTSQMAGFESLMQGVQHGLPIPPESVIEQNPFFTTEIKDRLLQQFQQQAEMQAQQQQQAQEAEIIKSRKDLPLPIPAEGEIPQ